jgi:hypothetical protein
MHEAATKALAVTIGGTATKNETKLVSRGGVVFFLVLVVVIDF